MVQLPNADGVMNGVGSTNWDDHWTRQRTHEFDFSSCLIFSSHQRQNRTPATSTNAMAPPRRRVAVSFVQFLLFLLVPDSTFHFVSGFVSKQYCSPTLSNNVQSRAFAASSRQLVFPEEHPGEGIEPSAMVEDYPHSFKLERALIRPPVLPRRSFLRNVALTTSSALVASTSAAMVVPTPASAATTATNKYLVPTPPLTKDASWPLGKVAFSLLPLAGTSTRRATVEECIVPNQIWTHDQIQGVVNVNVPVRQTVVALSSGGGLWVHNPVAPTPQLLQMMQNLIDQYGPVKHIVLGTVALEHKATLGDFASHYPDATVWIQPGQWAFPLPLPIEFYGLPQRGPRLQEIPTDQSRSSTTTDGGRRRKYQYYAREPEWLSDFDYEVLGPLNFQSVGGFSETAFYHKNSSSLIVTDVVVSVTNDPPPIVQEDPRALLFHARDTAIDPVVDSIASRQKGWRRMVQFGSVFFPSHIAVRSVNQALEEAKNVPPELRNLGEGAIPGSVLYPWAWVDGDADRESFDAISQNGKLFCPPILTKLILDREPQRTLEFVDRVSQRFKDMKRIIPCHLNNNVAVRDSKEFYDAFDPLRSRPDRPVPQRALAEDLALLQKASDLLTQYGIVAQSQVCDGEPARRKGRFASNVT